MRLLVKTHPDEAQRGLDGSGYNIPNSTITWLSIIYAIVTILSNSLSNFISNFPQRALDDKTFELKSQNFQLQILQRVLEVENENDRKMSLELLVRAGLLRNSNELLDFIEKSKQTPKWPSRTLEALNSYLSVSGSGYLQSSINYPNAGLGITNETPPGNINNSSAPKSGGSTPRSARDSTQKAVE